MKSVLLASISPRRRELLDQIGVTYTVVAPDYEEDMTLNMAATELAVALATGKARSVESKASPSQVIVAADTFIEFDGVLLGKPETPERAREMLQMLRGKHNVVHTGYCIIGAEEGEFTAEVVSSIIKMRDYGDDLIEQYLATGEPMDKAGAYALNAKGAILVDRVIDGDVSAIIGLPLGPVADVLVDYGVNVWQTSLPVI